MYNDINIQNDRFSASVITCDYIVIDDSGSMDDGVKDEAVRKGLKIIKNRLTSMEDTTSTRVSRVEFGGSISATDLVELESFDTEYYAGTSCTRLYDTVCYLKDQIFNLFDEYSIKKGYKLNINVIFLSDGYDVNSTMSKEDAIRAVAAIKEKTKASMLFYNIGNSAIDEARKLGFTVSSLDETEESILQFSEQISQKLVESSQSGTTIEALSKMMSSSSLATEEYKELMEQTTTNDPFKDLFEYV